MATRGFIAGPYVWTYNARVIGISEDGWRFNQTVAGDPIRGDNLGDAMQDYVYRAGDVTVESVLNEWDIVTNGLTGDAAKTNSNTASILWPWAALGSTGQVGRLASVVAAVLVGTPAPGTSAASATAGSRIITVSYAVIAPGFNFSLLFAARLRNCPIRMQALPSPLVDSGSEAWYAFS
jgi:hypothetical protein